MFVKDVEMRRRWNRKSELFDVCDRESDADSLLILPFLLVHNQSNEILEERPFLVALRPKMADGGSQITE